MLDPEPLAESPEPVPAVAVGALVGAAGALAPGSVDAPAVGASGVAGGSSFTSRRSV